MTDGNGFKVTAICVKSVDYNESDKIVTLCSVENGKVTAKLKGVNKITSKLKYAGQPFCFGEYRLVGKGGKYIIAECKQIESFSCLSKDLKNYYAGFAILKVLSDFSAENVSNPTLTLYAVKALKAIAFDGMEPTRAFNKFVYHALAELGFDLDFRNCAVCGKKLDEAYFSVGDGIVCASCGSVFKTRVPTDVLKCMQNDMSGDDITQNNTALFLKDIAAELLGIKIAIPE